MKRRLLVAGVCVAILGGAVAVKLTQVPKPPRTIARYLDALVRGEYERAYALTNLAALPTGAQAPENEGVDRLHFAAFYRAHRLARYRASSRGSRTVTLTFRDGSTETASFIEIGSRVALAYWTKRIGSNTGSLPSLSIDGVPVRLVPDGEAKGGHHSYRIVLMAGEHRVDVGEGPATAAVTATLAHTADSISFSTGASDDLVIGLRPSAKGRAAAESLAARSVRDCTRAHPCTATLCDANLLSVLGMGATLAAVDGLRGALSTEIVSTSSAVLLGSDSAVPDDGWALRVTGAMHTIEAAPLLLGSTDLGAKPVRFTVTFAPGRAPKVTERCWKDH